MGCPYQYRRQVYQYKLYFTVPLPTHLSSDFPITASVLFDLDILLRPTNTRPNNTGQLLLTHTIQQTNSKRNGTNKSDSETSKQPEWNTDILLLAHVTAPALRLLADRTRLGTVTNNSSHAAAREAGLVVRLILVPVNADTMATRAIVGPGLAAVGREEASRDARLLALVLADGFPEGVGGRRVCGFGG